MSLCFHKHCLCNSVLDLKLISFELFLNDFESTKDFIFKFISAQNTLQAFLSKSVVMEGDPVTIICGTRHFESPSTTLICTVEIALFKLNATSGKFVELFFYNNIGPSESQKNIVS